MKNHQSDRELVRRVLRGDIECFSSLVRDYGPRMLHLAAGIVGADAAEDVVQEVLVKAYEKLGTWRGQSALATWLYRITYTTAVSSLRGQRALQWGPEASNGAILAEDGAEDWQLTEANIARMRHALALMGGVSKRLNGNSAFPSFTV